LTALNILRRTNEKVPESGFKLYDSYDFSNHARKGRAARRLFFKAHRWLRKMEYKFNNNARWKAKHVSEPVIEAWMKERQARTEARKVLAGVNNAAN